MLITKNDGRFAEILKEELMPALGCTEPIAVALAAAKSRELLGAEPEEAVITCSGNIVKNVKGVTVPNSDGQKGIIAAAALGMTGGRSERGLEVLIGVTDAERKAALDLMSRKIFSCRVMEGEENLYVSVAAKGGGHSSEAVIAHSHTGFVKLQKDGEILLDETAEHADTGVCEDDFRKAMTVEDVLNYAESADLAETWDVLERQIEMNTAIADYGINNKCGCEIGRVMLKRLGSSLPVRAAARAAAGSDARMSGCPLPVVINSGSGNQGLTVSLPVIEYAEALGADRNALHRALLISNLIAIHQKSYIGKLSAFCGVVGAACGAGAAICYLNGGDRTKIAGTITNVVASIGGMFCDGAKASCASKIASAVFAAILAYSASDEGDVFSPQDGIVQEDIEKTLECVGYIGKSGMKVTDDVILKIMTDQISFSGC